ncbi:6-phospho-3-hexuloisomerase [Propionibacterium australiense]|uniref:SIS domain-containing protein n=1 Tax=Propionibacterium australiense TaxID=119981 RepID=A0A383S2L9_9ACTN|nr:6-phospho-3-hexuloisomerase [Propionibacterium australiense]RLP11555.1 SIS domain-containing protein [Propionibacterium australiense]RLP12711.1 SIS domain-containing protein [Propionibacterium australiense]SYZ32268.1 Sugar isomerase (SIS) [Propionibacterium australiense]VEH90549.1 3-hexulose-6-phosphate isomerase [Propionibacterium australiense]
MPLPELNTIIDELTQASAYVDREQVRALCEACQRAERVFVSGAGRSGFVARALSNRLLHLGINVSFVGEPTTPPITANDLLIIISGSGATASLRVMAEKACALNATLATITLNPQGPVAQMASHRIILPGRTHLAMQVETPIASKQFSGSLFEQMAWLTCDALVMLLRHEMSQSVEVMQTRHANLE